MNNNNSIDVKITADIAGLTNGVKQAEQAVNAAVSSMRSALAGLNSSFAGINTGFNQLGQSAANAGTGANNLNNSSGNLRGTLNNLSSLLTTLNNHLTNINNSFARVNSTTNNTTNNINNINNSVHNLGNTTNNTNIIINNFNNVINNTHNNTNLLGGSLGGLLGSFMGLLSINKVVDIIKDANAEFMASEQSAMKLNAMTNKMGEQFVTANDKAKLLASDGLISLKTAQNAMANAIGKGMTSDEAFQAVKGAKVVASINRQKGKTIDNSINEGFEGFKQGLSSNVDNMGVTKNLSVIEAEYADKLKKSTTELNEREKALGFLNEVTKQAADYQEQYNAIIEGSQGSSGRLDSAIKNFSETLGEALAPAMNLIREAATGLIDSFNLLIRVVEIFGASLGLLNEVFMAVNEFFADLSVDKFTNRIKSATQAWKDMVSTILSTKGATYDATGTVKDKPSDDKTNKQLYKEAKDQYDKEIALKEQKLKVDEQLMKFNLEVLKSNNEKKLISDKAYVEQSKAIYKQLYEAQANFQQERINGIEKMINKDTGVAFGADATKLALDKIDAETKKKMADFNANNKSVKMSSGGGGSSRDTMGAAEYKYIKTENEAKYQLSKTINEGELELIKHKFGKGLATAQEYYAKVAELDKNDFEQQKKRAEEDIAKLNQRKGSSKNKVEQKQLDTEILKLTGDLSVAQEKYNNKIKDGARELADYNEEMKRKQNLANLEVKTKGAEANLDNIRSNYELQYTMGNINNLQMLELEKSLAEAKTQIMIEDINAKKEARKNDLDAQIELNKELELLAIDHASRINQINNQITAEATRDHREFMNSVKGAVGGMLADIAKHPRNFKDAMLKALGSIEDKMLEMAQKKLMDQIFGTSSSGSSGGDGIFGSVMKMFSSSGSSGGAAASGASEGGSWLSAIGSLFSYDVGTNYVPNDQIARIHKGEAIVPAKYNNAETFGGKRQSVNINNHFNTTSTPDRRTQAQMAALAAASIANSSRNR